MSKMQEARFVVQGMDCEDEVRAVRTALLSLPGVGEVESNFITSEIKVLHEETLGVLRRSNSLAQAAERTCIPVTTLKSMAKRYGLQGARRARRGG